MCVFSSVYNEAFGEVTDFTLKADFMESVFS